jgi:hypothetical protein
MSRNAHLKAPGVFLVVYFLRMVQEEEQRVVVSSSKVCRQQLPLPPGVSVIQFVPAAGHLSSSRNVANSLLKNTAHYEF